MGRSIVLIQFINWRCKLKVKFRTVSYNGRDYEVFGARASYSVNRDGLLEDLELAERGDYHLCVEVDGLAIVSTLPVIDPKVIAELDNLLLNQLEDELLRELPEPDTKDEDRADYELDLLKDRRN